MRATGCRLPELGIVESGSEWAAVGDSIQHNTVDRPVSFHDEAQAFTPGRCPQKDATLLVFHSACPKPAAFNGRLMSHVKAMLRRRMVAVAVSTVVLAAACGGGSNGS